MYFVGHFRLLGNFVGVHDFQFNQLSTKANKAFFAEPLKASHRKIQIHYSTCRLKNEKYVNENRLPDIKPGIELG